MDSTEKLTALEQVSECIRANENFVLQGGAGSGKTETLKRVLNHITNNSSKSKVACITHTNLAVEEIISRVGENDYSISTIHSFLNSLIKGYKKNIHKVLFHIFKLEKINRKGIAEYKDEKEQKKKEHEKYKKLFEKYAHKLYTVNKTITEKVEGKRLYDLSPEKFNQELNSKIEILNTQIAEIIETSDYNKIGYNETRFDNFNDLTFGHDSLLKVTSLLFQKYPLLSRIIQDKFDVIFIDEYQDTSQDVIEVLLTIIPPKSQTVIGLFGDSMQGIYEDGIGDVETYVAENGLHKIEKEDNYRCSEQVVDFINQIRNDGLKQKVAFKTKDGVTEAIDNRQGFVKLYYAYYPDKPHVRSSVEDKDAYLDTLKSLTNKIENIHPNFKKLMLTNKSISKEIGFSNLYQVFDDRYFDVKDEIEKCLARIQLIDLVELCDAYEKRNYNFILSKIKKAGFVIENIAHKKKVADVLDIVTTSNESAINILELAFDNKLLRKSESYSSYISRKDSFLADLKNEEGYKEFKKAYMEGDNTFNKIVSNIPVLNNERFTELEKLFRKERFFRELFSDKIKFKEIFKYFKYLNEETELITMHKTKGSGIQNVLVVLEEYFWNKYSFKRIFDSNDIDLEKRLHNQKLFYVACSRAIDNLICVKLIEKDEEAALVGFFKDYEKLEM